ncbi:MAG: winged helix-turn-helix domain-containing protein [Candidatus Saccharibacteria bacterium]|nr:winged helix-turn-helix domain-containing protein [Pseudorhodobacter sp.]
MPLWVEAGPDPVRDGVVRWRRQDLPARRAAAFGVEPHERSVGTQLAARGFRRLSVHPQHPKSDPQAQAAFKNVPQAVAAAKPERDKPLEIWFQKEAGVGHQATLPRIWARRGTRPRTPRDTRSQWADLFGAVCPARGTAAGLVLPFVNKGGDERPSGPDRPHRGPRCPCAPHP